MLEFLQKLHNETLDHAIGTTTEEASPYRSRFLYRLLKRLLLIAVDSLSIDHRASITLLQVRRLQFAKKRRIF